MSPKSRSRSGPTERDPDVVIVGGGFAGVALAAALGSADVPCLLVDRADPRQAPNRPDGRSFAIAKACANLLEATGVAAHLKDRVQPIRHIRVTDGASPLFLHYAHDEVGEEAFGYMVETPDLRRALWARVAELPSVAVRAPAEIVSIDRRVDGASVVFADGEVVRTRLIAACDGRQSKTRQAAGIKVSGWSYGQVGIVGTVVHEKPHGGVAHERFLPSGPFAILPLTGNRSSIVWTEREHLGRAVMAMSDDEFMAQLGQRFGDFLGAIRMEGPRLCYPLTLQVAERATDDRLALVADAYHGMHPIAGQGLNMGLRDVAALAEVVVETRRLGLDVGSSVALARYARWRRFDNALMLGLTDVLNRLFSNNIPPLKLARDLGLAVVNKLPRTKRFFMRHAMGQVGDRPRLLKGEAL